MNHSVFFVTLLERGSLVILKSWWEMNHSVFFATLLQRGGHRVTPHFET